MAAVPVVFSEALNVSADVKIACVGPGTKSTKRSKIDWLPMGSSMTTAVAWLTEDCLR